jgi:hypothetical protein
LAFIKVSHVNLQVDQAGAFPWSGIFMAEVSSIGLPQQAGNKVAEMLTRR